MASNSNPNALFITSTVVSVGLLAAWGITAGVSCANKRTRAEQRSERDSIIRPILGDNAVNHARIDDAVSDGTMDKATGEAIKQVLPIRQTQIDGIKAPKVERIQVPNLQKLVLVK